MGVTSNKDYQVSRRDREISCWLRDEQNVSLNVFNVVSDMKVLTHAVYFGFLAAIMVCNPGVPPLRETGTIAPDPRKGG